MKILTETYGTPRASTRTYNLGFPRLSSPDNEPNLRAYVALGGPPYQACIMVSH